MPSSGTSVSSLTLYFFLILSKAVLEVLVVDAHDDVAEHVDQAAIGVVGEPLVAGGVRQAFDDCVVQAEVEDRVHHAGHRGRGAGADGDEQRDLRVAELLARLLLELGDVLAHFVHQARRAASCRSCSTGRRPRW